MNDNLSTAKWKAIHEQLKLSQCTKCLQNLDNNEFYLKANRRDSMCKECKKEQRRASYLASKNIVKFESFKKICDIVFYAEHARLDELKRRLEGVLKKCQKRN